MDEIHQISPQDKLKCLKLWTAEWQNRAANFRVKIQTAKFALEKTLQDWPVILQQKNSCCGKCVEFRSILHDK